MDRCTSNVLRFVTAGVFLVSFLEALQLNQCPGSAVDDIRREAIKYELSFIFYHVAWSKESQAARSVFDQIAEQYMEEAHFARIDCYHLQCNCSKTHPLAPGSGTPHKWPTLIVQYGQRFSLQYNGEWNIAPLRRLMYRLLMPVERVHNREEVKAVSMRSDAVVLGLFPSYKNRYYRRFVTAAVKWIETDSEHSFQFVAAFGTDALAVLQGANVTMEKLPLLLLLSSEGIDRAPKSVWNVNNILLWLKTEFRRTFTQLHAYSSPKTLASQLLNGPVLGVAANDYFYNYMDILTKPNRSLQNICTSRTSKSDGQDRTLQQEKQFVQHVQNQLKINHPGQSYSKELISHWHLRHYFGLNAYLKEFFCELDPSCAINNPDDISATNLLQKFENMHCLNQGRQYSKIAVAKYLKQYIDTTWLEVRNDKNNSLSVCVFDSAEHEDFLELHSIRSPNINSVAIFIIDPRKESTYILDGQFNYNTFKRFIHNYFVNDLVATRKSADRQFSLHRPAALRPNYLNTLNRQMFLDAVTQKNMTTVLLLYSPQCAYSALLSQSLNQLVSMLDSSANINFIRINIETNDMPWELTMDSSPTLIVFPRGHAVDSRVFPTHLRANTRNVFGFILAQMEPADQIKAVFSSCKRRKANSLKLDKCLRFAKSVIDQQLLKVLMLQPNIGTERQQALMQQREFNYVILEMKRYFGHF